MKTNITEKIANLVGICQARILRMCGFAIVRDNPCRQRIFSLSQSKYFETFDYVRLAQLELLASHLTEFEVLGDCAELGVYKGYFAQKLHNFFPERKLYLYDTFEGFDSRDLQEERRVSLDSATDDFCSTSVSAVLRLFQNQDNIIIRQGYFPQTAQSSDGPFALVSLDVDLYKPTLEGLKFFYPRLSSGGVILVHDYHNTRYPGVKKAVREFCPHGHSALPIPDKNGSVVLLKP